MTPNFTAETALYRTSRTYRTADHGGMGLPDRIRPSTVFPGHLLYPAQLDNQTMAPDDGGDSFGATCTSACCGLCSCCANSGGAACCRFCMENCG